MTPTSSSELTAAPGGPAAGGPIAQNAIRPRSESTSWTGLSFVSLISSRALSTLSQTFQSSTPRTCPDRR